jgi:uncharacterized membrane protein YoaK (UPF0700 family)
LERAHSSYVDRADPDSSEGFSCGRRCRAVSTGSTSGPGRFDRLSCHGSWISRHWGSLGADVAARFRTASQISPGERGAARELLSTAKEYIRSVVGSGVLILPSASSVALPIDAAAVGGEDIEAVRRSTMQLTCIAGIAGLPAVNVPLFTADGLPCGVSLIGPAGTFSTGVIDAVGYLGLDRVFTGNMTGNVVILGMALVGADGLPVLGPAVALAAFMTGAVIAGRTLKPEAAGWSRRTTVLLAAVGLILSGIAAVLFAHAPREGDPVTVVVTGAMAAAMGLQAATARHLSVKDVTTVVVTSTLTGLAADSRLGGGTGQHWGRRFGAVILILAGAAAGAALLNVHIGFGVLLSAILSVAVACAGATTSSSKPEAKAPEASPAVAAVSGSTAR